MISASKAKFFQIALEALIPLLGFWDWNWSLYFILLFYFIDLVAGEVVINLKSKRISDYQNIEKTTWFRRALLSFSFLLVSILVGHYGVYLFDTTINFKDEIIAFWSYKEMGIQQGFFLVPLVFIAAYQQYRMDFLMRGLERKMMIENLWKGRYILFIALITFSLFLTLLVYFSVLTEVILVHTIVAGVTLFKLYEQRSI